MEKTEVLECISNIKYGKDYRKSFDSLKDYLEGIDLSSDDKWARRLRKIIQKDEFPLKRELLTILDYARSKFFDKAIKLGISEKEVLEVEHFNQNIKRYFDGVDRINDFCSGNGLNALYWNGIVNEIHLYDIIRSKDLEKVLPYLENAQFHQQNIYSDVALNQGLFTSIHACGNLTDRVIDLAIQTKSPFAVMPCCNNLKDNLYYGRDDLQYFENPDDAINSARVSRIKSEGYECIIRCIPPQITPKNLIIMGKLIARLKQD